jgi:hypothetical protein
MERNNGMMDDGWWMVEWWSDGTMDHSFSPAFNHTLYSLVAVAAGDPPGYTARACEMK